MGRIEDGDAKMSDNDAYIAEFVKKMFNRFFYPALLSYICIALSGIVESICVGQSSGDEGLFILGAGTPVYLFLYMVSLGLSEGGTILFTRYMSEGDVKEARRSFFSVLVFLLVVVLGLMALCFIFTENLVSLLGVTPSDSNYQQMLEYIRLMIAFAPLITLKTPFQLFVHADGQPNLSSGAVLTGAFADGILSFVFVNVMGMGPNGVVFAFSGGALVTELICMIHFLDSRKGVTSFFRWEGTKWYSLVSFKRAVESFRVGFATGAQYIYEFIVTLSFNRLLLRVAGMGYVAIYDVVLNVGELVATVISAAVIGMLPLSSMYYGERNKRGVVLTLRHSMRMVLFFTLAGVIVIYVFAGSICHIMGLSDELAKGGIHALRMYVMSLIPTAVNMTISIFLETIEKEKYAYIITALGSFLFILPFGEFLSFGGARAFWSAFLLSSIAVTAVITIFYFLRIGKGSGKGFIDFDESKVFSETFEGKCDTVSDVCERIQVFLAGLGASKKKAYMVTVAVDEVCRLIAETEDGELLKLQLTLVAEDGKYILHIRDNNAGSFNPFEIPEDDERMLGLMIVKNQALGFYYMHYVGFNTLTIDFAAEG